jgi:hypothetical protein
MNASIYSSLSLINQAFEQIEQHIQSLRDSRLITDESCKGWQIRTSELRAEINHKLVSILIDKERDECAHFGKLRIKLEKRLARNT